MDDAHDAQPEQSPYVRLPWGLVAGGLVGVLLVALGIGLFATRYLRPQATVIPTPIARITATTPAAATGPVAAPPAPTTTPAPTAARTPTPVSAASEIPMGATALPATATPPNVQPTLSPGTPSSVVTARPTVSAVLAAEIDDAYQHYWQIRAEALLNLDPSRLPEVVAGEHLAALEKLIVELQTERHALLTDVDHKYAILSASVNEAEIADTYTDASVYVDPNSHEPLSEPTNDLLEEHYSMIRIDGMWRVVSLVRAQ